MANMKQWILVALFALVGSLAVLAQDATQTGSWTVEIDGRKTWTVRYGMGDSLALAGASISVGELSLEQTMAVDFTATALGIFRVEGSFDDQKSDDFQSFSVYMDTQHVDGVAGDFTAPDLGGFFAGSRAMLGARLDYIWDEGTAIGIASRLSGVRDSRQFVGQTALGERVFAGRRGDEGVAYATSLDGLGYVDLVSLYVEDFTDVSMMFETADLAAVLAQYGVPELAAPLAEFGGIELDAGDVAVVGSNAQSLVVRVEPANLAREALRQAIRDYNAGDAEDNVSYPFVIGSEVERQFLAAMTARALLVVGGDVYRVSGLGWNRFLDLGEEEVDGATVKAVATVDGEQYAVGDPDLEGFAMSVHPEAGIVEVAFPESFFSDPNSRLDITFAYPTGGTYLLGSSVISGSESVTLAGRPLVRDRDYTIDYEVGLLWLLVDIGPTDYLVVEFERYGSAGSYGRSFYGAVLSVPAGDWSLASYVLRGMDDQSTVTNPESVKTMPNSQTVLGVTGALSGEDLEADFSLGYTDDLFPYDDNERDPMPNRVNAIAGSANYVFVGHDAGFSVRAADGWHAYGAGSGLAGKRVRAIVVVEDRVFFGTEGGLTVVTLEGVSPLDKAANWERYGRSDGLLDLSVRALAVDGDVLWVGTDGGLFRVPLGEMGDPDAWLELDDAALEETRSLCLADGALYVGTTSAFVTVAREDGGVLATAVGDAVLDLATDGESVYAGGPLGLRRFVGGALAEWVASDVSVLSVDAWDDDVFYGTSSGLRRASDGEAGQTGWAIGALAVVGGSLWEGTRASGDGELVVWERAADGRLQAYDAATTEIEPQNPFAYADVRASDHTTTGWTAEASFSHEGEGFSIAGSAERVLAGFRPIDGAGRTDEGGWKLAVGADLGTLGTLSFDTGYTVSDIASADEETSSLNRVVLRGLFSPAITLAVTYDAEDTSAETSGFDKHNASYDLDLSHRLFNDLVALSIGWSQGFRWDLGRTPRQTTALSADIDWQVVPEVDTSLSLSRPVRLVGDSASGSEAWVWKTDASFDLAGVGVSSTYTLDASRALPTGKAEVAHALEMSAATPALDAGGWSVSPTLDLTAGLEKGVGEAGGRLSVRTTGNGFSMRTTGSLDVTGLGGATRRWTEKLTSSISYSAIPDLRPTANYSGSRVVTQVKGQGEKVTWSHSATGRVSWAAGGTTEEFELVGRIQSSGSANVSVENAVSIDILPTLSGWVPALAEVQTAGGTVRLRTEVGADWRRDEDRDDMSWRVGATADMRLSETWSMALGVTYRGGIKTSADAFHGLVIEMTAAIDF